MGARAGGTPERPALFFDGPEDFRAWLEEHHGSETGLWMGLRGKHVPDRGLTWEDAVLEALCYGWIDSTSQRLDADSHRQRWTPRRPGSVWSAVNVAHVERLTAEGRMRPAGLAAFAGRSEDRTAVYSYERRTDLTREQRAALEADPAAAAFWAQAAPGYQRAVASWLGAAKQQATRDRRLAQLVQDCAAGRLAPPQRYGDPPAWLSRAAEAARAAQAAGGETSVRPDLAQEEP